MRLIETLPVRHRDGDRRIELLVGDLSDIPVEHAVDALVVSAFQGNYAPLPRTLIGALNDRDLSVADLALHKEVDLRDFSACWLSEPIDRPELNFRHLLCFEPASLGKKAPDVVGDVFRSLIPYVTGEPWIASVALPLLAAGNQRADPVGMLRSILDAAVHWLSTGLPLQVMKIVIFDQADAQLVAAATELFRSYIATAKRISAEAQRSSPTDWDLFVSYSHVDTDIVSRLVDQVRARDPAARIFYDRRELDAGAAWQQRIFDAIDASRRVVCLFSPDYLRSRVCMEEYNIAHLRNREEDGVLIPAYLRTATRLPSYMRLVQYVDVREGDVERMDQLACQLVDYAVKPGEPLPRQAYNRRSSKTAVSLSTDAAIDLARAIDVLVDGKEIRLELTVRRIDDEAL